MTKLIWLDSLLQEVCIKYMWDYIAHSYSGFVSLESQWSSTILCFYLVCMHTQYLWLMPKYWLITIFVADANILAEYWHEPNDTIYWEGPLSCGMYGTIAKASFIKIFYCLPTLISHYRGGESAFMNFFQKIPSKLQK